jgi:hypothetical protein
VVVSAASFSFLFYIWRPDRIRAMLAARLRANPNLWWAVITAYGQVLGFQSDGGVTETTADYTQRVLGRRRFREVANIQLPDVLTKLRRDLAGTEEYEEAQAHREAET